MTKRNFFYDWLCKSRKGQKTADTKAYTVLNDRTLSLMKSHNLVGNFFHYRTAIEILGWEYSDVFEEGRLDLDPDKWADFGPANFQLGPPAGVSKSLKRITTNKNLVPYPPNLVPSLRDIASKALFKRSCSRNFEISCTEGAHASVAYSVMTFVNPGDEVIITDPGYFFLEPPVLVAGGRVKRVILTEKSGYRINVESLKKKITPKTKMIIICDPINPFGTIQTKDELKEIVRIANKYNIIVLDNITHSFHRLNERVKHHPMSALDKVDTRNVITITGLSHGFGLAGLRIGFMAGHPDLLGPILAMESALTRVNINLLMQYGAQAALEDKEYFPRCAKKLKRNLSILEDIVDNNPLLSFVVKPDYGYVTCIDTSKIKASCQELTVALLKRKCAVYPSDGLGDTKSTSYLRLNFSTPRREHFRWLEKALPEAIEEAESGEHRKAVIDFFRSVGTKRSEKIIKILKDIDR
ncbi:MAG: pyridoxal phosphate-dependent aminotransferase [Elusimicrobiota bacterium]